MGLIQTGGTLHVSPEGVEAVGDMQLDYSCDGSAAKRGDPYAHIITVVLARDGSDVDSSEADGWTFFWDEPEGPCTRSYCPKCAPPEAA
jgi:hypothetical protein